MKDKTSQKTAVQTVHCAILVVLIWTLAADGVIARDKRPPGEGELELTIEPLSYELTNPHECLVYVKFRNLGNEAISHFITYEGFNRLLKFYVMCPEGHVSLHMEWLGPGDNGIVEEIIPPGGELVYLYDAFAITGCGLDEPEEYTVWAVYDIGMIWRDQECGGFPDIPPYWPKIRVESNRVKVFSRGLSPEDVAFYERTWGIMDSQEFVRALDARPDFPLLDWMIIARINDLSVAGLHEDILRHTERITRTSKNPHYLRTAHTYASITYCDMGELEKAAAELRKLDLRKYPRSFRTLKMIELDIEARDKGQTWDGSLPDGWSEKIDREFQALRTGATLPQPQDALEEGQFKEDELREDARKKASDCVMKMKEDGIERTSNAMTFAILALAVCATALALAVVIRRAKTRRG